MKFEKVFAIFHEKIKLKKLKGKVIEKFIKE